MITFMEAFPLCLLLNKPQLFGLTQHRFILIQSVTLTHVTCFGLYEAIFREVNTKNHTKEKNIAFYFRQTHLVIFEAWTMNFSNCGQARIF
jgi:hypothetical protein